MKALSLRQPWAWAIAHAGKRIENRTWSHLNRGLAALPRLPFGGVQPGEVFAIHASLSMKEYDVAGVLDAVFDMTEQRELPAAAYQRSAIIAVCTCIGVLNEQGGVGDFASFPSEEQVGHLDALIGAEAAAEQLDRWWIGPHALVLADVVALPEPVVDVKGALYFWTLQPADHQRVAAQLARAA